MKNTIQTDVIIIGAGPVGLFSIFQCGMMGLRCHVLDALEMVGGQCAALYPEKPIYDIPAHPMISGQGLVDQLKEQAAAFDPAYHLGTQAQTIKKEDDYWHVTMSTGQTLQAKSILIAAGVGAFGPKRPPIDNLVPFEKSGAVQYFIRQRAAFQDKTIVIAGGGDSALDWTISLSEIAKKIILVHRRDNFRAAPDSVAKIDALVAAGIVEKAIPYQLKALSGDEATGSLEQVILSHLDGSEKSIPADILLPFFGLATDLGPLSNWGLNLHKTHISVDPTSMETSAAGIFAIGDVADYPGKLKLILTGFSEAAIASHRMRALAFPDKVFHFEYSTTQGQPGSPSHTK